MFAEDSPIDLIDDGKLVHVEDQAGNVTQDEDGDDDHEDDGHAVLPHPPPLPPPPDGQVDLGVEEGDAEEW